MAQRGSGALRRTAPAKRVHISPAIKPATQAVEKSLLVSSQAGRHWRDAAVAAARAPKPAKSLTELSAISQQMKQQLQDVDAASLLSLAGKMRKTVGRGRLPASSHAHHADILHLISSSLNHARQHASSTVAHGFKAQPMSSGWNLSRIAGLARETANAASSAAHTGQLPQVVSIAQRRVLSNIGSFAEPMLQRSSARSLANARGQFQSDAGFGVRMLAIGGYVNLALSAGLFLWGDHLREIVAERLAGMQVAEAAEHSAQWDRVRTNPNGISAAAALEVDTATVISGTTATTTGGTSTYSSLSSTAPEVLRVAAACTAGIAPPASPTHAAAAEDVRAFLDIVMALSSPQDGMLAADAGSTKKRWRNSAIEGSLPFEEPPSDEPTRACQSDSRATSPAKPASSHVPFVGRHAVPAVLARCIIAGAPSLLLAAPHLPDDTIVHALRTLQSAQAVAAAGPVAATTEALVSALGLELGHRVATRGVGGVNGVSMQALTQAAAASLSLHAALSRADGTVAAASAAALKHGPSADHWAAAAGLQRGGLHKEAQLPGLPVDSLHTHSADVLASARDVVAPVGGRGLLFAAAAAGGGSDGLGGGHSHETHAWEDSGVAPSLAALAADALSAQLQMQLSSGQVADSELVQQAVHALHDMRVARIKGGAEHSTPVSEQALSLSLLNSLGSLCDQHAGMQQGRQGLQIADVYPPLDTPANNDADCAATGDANVAGTSALEYLLGGVAQAASDVRRQTLRLLLESQSLPPLAQPSAVSACDGAAGGAALMSAAYCSVSGPQRTPAAAAAAAPSVGMHTRSHAAATAVRVRAGVMAVLCSKGADAPVLSMPLRELALLARLSTQGGLQRGTAPPQLAQAIAGALQAHAQFIAQCGKGDMGSRGADSVSACAEWAQAFLSHFAGQQHGTRAQHHAAEALVAAASIAASSRDWAQCRRWLAAAAPHSRLLTGSGGALDTVRCAAKQAQLRSKNTGIVQLASQCSELVRAVSRRPEPAVAAAQGRS